MKYFSAASRLRGESNSGRRGSFGARRAERGLTLLEVLVSLSILILIATLIYGAFDGMSRSRQNLTAVNDRYHQGRGAVGRLARELESAFLSAHQPLSANMSVRTTAFIGKRSNPADRLDFATFAHRRFGRDTHESDQCELGYFGSVDPEHHEKLDLARRESPSLDLEPTEGGVINVVAEDIEGFELEYLDMATGEWTDTWDSTQTQEQFGRLPLQVRIALSLKGPLGRGPVRVETKVVLPMQTPLSFASVIK